jgi:Peptidase family M1 domain
MMFSNKYHYPIYIISSFLLITLWPKEGFSNTKEINPIKISQYDISVLIPPDCSHLEIDAFLSIEGYPLKNGRFPNIILCQGFSGTKASHIKITDQERNTLEFKVDSTILFIPNVQRKDKLHFGLHIQYWLEKDSSFPADIYSEFAREFSDSLCYINASITRTDNWYPKIDGSMNDRLPPFSLHFDMPLKFEIIASGQLCKEEVTGGRRISHWKNYDEITDRGLFFYALSNRRKVVIDYPKSFRVILIVPRNSDENQLRKVADLGYKTYGFFENFFGPITGNEFKIIGFLNNYGSGLNFAVVPINYFTTIPSQDLNGYPYRSFIHEISHSWWGNLISFDAKEDYWLYEGFAGFSEIKALNPVLGIDIEDKIFRLTRMASLPYLDYTQSIGHSGYETIRQLQEVSAYYEGATLLHYLQYIMGQEKFALALKKYVSEYTGKKASSADFAVIIEKNSTSQIRETLEQYVSKAGYGEYSILNQKSIKKKNRIVKTYILSNKGNKNIFTELFVNSHSDSFRRFIHIRPGRNFRFKIFEISENDSVIIQLDPSGTLPLREYGKLGGGGTAFKKDDGIVKFCFVAKNTPFEKAGIEDGMELLAINGIAVSHLRYEEISNRLLNTSGIRLVLRIKNNNNKESEVIVNY